MKIKNFSFGSMELQKSMVTRSHPHKHWISSVTYNGHRYIYYGHYI